MNLHIGCTLEVSSYASKVSRTLQKKPQVLICTAYLRAAHKPPNTAIDPISPLNVTKRSLLLTKEVGLSPK